jgi:hypothetical protein
VLALTLATAHFAAAADEQCITNGTNVRLRAAPQRAASIAFELPIGTELSVLERSGAPSDPWLRVRTNDGRTGWVLGRLTTKIDAQRSDDTVESILLDQLKKEADSSFEARLQVFDFIEQRSGRVKDREREARFALYRLRSMQHVFASIPSQGNDRDPYRDWIAKHDDAARYNSPAGAWMVDPEYVKRIHDRYRDTNAADEIAWLYVGNGLTGECEGDVPCYVRWTNALEGWYLRTHPTGKHTDDANAEIALKLNDAMDNLRNFPSVLAEFDPSKRCRELRTALEPLATAVTASTSSRGPGALAAIERFVALCNGR